MKISKLLFTAMAASFFITSCSNDDDVTTPPVETGDYENGIFVINEGNFGSGNASISFIDTNLENVTNNVFSSVNDGEALGDTGQSMAFYENYAFIVVNVSNKIEVVERTTFERVATIDEGLVNPRYVAFANGNAYVTNWGDGGNAGDDYIAVIDVESFEIEENIGVAEGPERILSDAERLYVAHQGGWSFNNTISVIDATSNTMVESITVGDVPNSMEIAQGSLWISSGGLPSYAEQETAGRISQVDLVTLEVVNNYEFPNATDHPSNLTVEEGQVFYTLGNSLYTFSTNEDELPEEALLVMEEVSQPRDLEVQGNRIYVTSASSDYTGNGALFVYDLTDASLLNELEVGIIPGGIYFNN